MTNAQTLAAAPAALVKRAELEPAAALPEHHPGVAAARLRQVDRGVERGQGGGMTLPAEPYPAAAPRLERGWRRRGRCRRARSGLRRVVPVRALDRRSRCFMLDAALRAAAPAGGVLVQQLRHPLAAAARASRPGWYSQAFADPAMREGLRNSVVDRHDHHADLPRARHADCVRPDPDAVHHARRRGAAGRRRARRAVARHRDQRPALLQRQPAAGGGARSSRCARSA